MPKTPPTLYSISKTFIWFALTSLILTGSLIAIVYIDYDREWKGWQKKFVQLKVEKTNKELQDASAKVDQKKLEALKKQYAEAEKEFKTHQEQYKATQKEAAALDTKITKIKTNYQTLKQFQDSAKYFYEEAALHEDPKKSSYAARLDKLGPQVLKAKDELDRLEKEKEAKDASLAAFLEKEKVIQKEIDKALEEKIRVERKLQNIKPTLAKEILNVPMIDFIAPTLKIQQVVLDNLYDDYHFTKTQKVDRCTTCHLGIDQKGFEDAPQPFRTHPKLDLFLGSNSPHPLEKIGCTVCHSGNGHSVSFKDSAHTPRNAEQAELWKKKYHWETLEKWDEKMLPMQHIEASCTKCHHNLAEIPQSATLNRGRKLAEVNGCFNCHKINSSTGEGEAGHWKVGPDLQNIQTKLTKEWVMKWLDDPTFFRPSTRMPKIFHLTNTSSPENRERNNAAIVSIAEYLMSNSKTVELEKIPVAGDAVKGEKLVKELGCLGCHSAVGIQMNDFGPELTGLGSKVTPEWLYTWIKNPAHVSKETRMPNFRLSDQEAADITSYLISQKNEAFENKPLPAASQKVVDEMILGFLQGTMRRSDAEAELSKMNAEQRLNLLGKKSIAYQGCFTCHAISGFEDMKPIGADLSNEGKKDLHQFDFGFAPIEHTRESFISQKLKDPRIFDQGKLKEYHEKLRMPQFNFTDEEVQALTTFVLSLHEDSIPLEMQKRLSSTELQIEQGRALVSKFNCNGCHTLDGEEGVLRKHAEDKGTAPPILDGEGAKVQEKWLHDFLKNPKTIRPWLTYRMPTFNLSDEEIETLVQYFDNLSNEKPSYQNELPVTSSEKLDAGKVLFDKLQCAKCHEVNPQSAAMGASFLAPDLSLAKDRLKAHWVKEWIKDPQALEEGTMMPTFFVDGQSPIEDVLGGNAEAQIEAIRDYLYVYTSKPASSEEAKDSNSKNPIAKSSAQS